MTDEQLKHYLKGGMFTAVYNPPKLDVSLRSRQCVGTTITVYQNMIISPLISPKQYEEQHAFSSRSIDGWFPEEDISNLVPIDEYLERPEPLPQYLYRITFTKEEQLFPNFGHGKWELPLIVGREYPFQMDKYVLDLSKPQATTIEKAVWKGEAFADIKWKKLL